jgi:hypothetical protein
LREEWKSFLDEEELSKIAEWGSSGRIKDTQGGTESALDLATGRAVLQVS